MLKLFVDEMNVYVVDSSSSIHSDDIYSAKHCDGEYTPTFDCTN